MSFDEVSEYTGILVNGWVNSHWPVTTLTPGLEVLVLSALFTEILWKKLVSQNQMDTNIAWNWSFSQKFGDNSGILRLIFKIPEMSHHHFEQNQFLNPSHPEVAVKHSLCCWKCMALLKLWLYLYPSSKCIASLGAAWPGRGNQCNLYHHLLTHVSTGLEDRPWTSSSKSKCSHFYPDKIF